MSMKKIMTKEAPAAIGPYSQAIQVDNLLFASGQIPINPETGAVEAQGIEEQTVQVMKNIGAILEAAGTNYDNLIKATLYITDLNDFTAIDNVYKE